MLVSSLDLAYTLCRKDCSMKCNLWLANVSFVAVKY